MKSLLLAATVALSLPASAQTKAASSAATLTLAQDGKTSYVIALPSDAIPAEKTAASELQKYLGQITGASFAIKGEKEVPTAAAQILVGSGQRVKALLPRQNWAALGHDGIVIKSSGNKLILAGGRNRGSLYAVYQFLEDSLGCRFWTPTENTIPPQSVLKIKPQSTVYVPTLKYREHYTASVRQNPVFATMMRENGHSQHQDDAWGGHYSIIGWCHTFSQFLPPEKYFKEHPEWYSDPTRGGLPCTAESRMPHHEETQLCMTNPGVLEEMTKQALSRIREDPKAGYISISQNDTYNVCRCPNCAKIIEEEGSPSGPLLKFVNAVAAKVAVEYPNFLVETLAYQPTEAPPKTIRPAKNVVIRSAQIENNFGYPLDSPQNATALANLQGWSKISSQLFVWNYITNFQAHWLPHPNWTGLGADLRTYAANKVTGVFEQGDTNSQTVGDFIQLRAWLISKLMWNPALDQEKLTNEFMIGYYGKAAPFLRSYLDTIEASFLKQNRRLRQDNLDFSYLNIETLNEASQLFDKAETAVKADKILLNRVQRERLVLTIAWLYRYRQLKAEAAAANAPFLGPADPLAATRQFVSDAVRHGENGFSPGAIYSVPIAALIAKFAPTALPDFAKGLAADDVLDVQQVDFHLYRVGEHSALVDDPAASDGKAASLTDNTGNWAVQAPLDRIFDGADNRRWHVYALLRVEPNPANASVPGAPVENMSLGIYDIANKKAVTEKSVSINELTGSSYQTIDLGIHNLTPKSYIWFAPPIGPTTHKILIDRIILIRQK